MNKRAIWVLLCCATAAGGAAAGGHVRAVGSSTVFPLVAAAAEQFGRDTEFSTPLIEVNGTGGGFKLFCDGAGEDSADIANASRPVKPAEIARCASHGVARPLEIPLGYDGLVLANRDDAPNFRLSARQLFLALAREVPQGDGLVKNPYTRWKQIDSALPDIAIRVYGPPPVEGSRDAFVELLMQPACAALPQFSARYADEKARQEACARMREDGAFIEILGGNVMIQKLINDREALAIFGFSYLDQNRGVVKPASIDGQLPNAASIESGRYTLARTLYVYVKREHLATRPGLREFLQFLTSDAAIGPDGFLLARGLIPLNPAARNAMHALLE